MKATDSSPLITICVTSYNHERFIGKCIDSLLSQNYPNLDIQVIDDCSTDNSLDILRSYGTRINLTTREKNLGVKAHGETINNVIKHCAGEYFYRIDSDDFIDSDYLGRLMDEVADDPKLDWICGGLNVVDAEGRVRDSWEYTDWPTDPKEALARGWKYCSVVIPHNGIFRTAFLRENNLYFHHFPYGWGEDVLFTIKGVLANPKVKLTAGTGFNWRTHGANNSCDVENRVRLILAVKEYYLENIPHDIFLTHPVLSQLQPGSKEYRAARDFLVAGDIYSARVNFRMPTMFERADTNDTIEKNLYLFDEVIRKYAESSLSLSPKFRHEISKLYACLDSEKQLVEGRHSLTLGDFHVAKSRFESVLKVDSKSVRALNGLTEASFSLFDLDRASNYSTRALNLAPADPTALNNAGVIMHSRGDLFLAERAFQSSLLASPASTATHCNLLSLYATMSSSAQLDKAQKDLLLSSTRRLAEEPVAPEKQPLKGLSDFLYNESLAKYCNSYHSETVRLLLHQPGNGALKYLMEAWAETLNCMGVKTELLSWGEDTRSRFETFRPTTFITVADPAFYQQLDTSFIARYRAERKLTVGQITTLEHKIEPVDFYITFHLDPDREKRYLVLDRPLISLPFAINPLRHRMRGADPIWDYFFVGSNSYRKRDRTEAFLEPLVKSYSGILAGTNWSTGIGEISVEQSADFYGFSAISPNYHLSEQIDSFNEVNERTFIIPACGAFQIVDNPTAMKELFAPDEMAVAETPAEYLEMFEHFLNNPAEREPYIEKGMRRVWREYTLFAVLEKLCSFLGCEGQKEPNKIVETAEKDSLRAAPLTP